MEAPTSLAALRDMVDRLHAVLGPTMLILGQLETTVERRNCVAERRAAIGLKQ
jgi:hypothetical protein